MASGACWAFGQMNQYRAFRQIGVSKTIPISTGLQLVFTALMGILIFGEWTEIHQLTLGLLALLLIVFGIWLTTKTEQTSVQSDNLRAGILTLLISTLGYVGYSYFPRAGELNAQLAFLPQATGMAMGALFFSLFLQKEQPYRKTSVYHLLSGMIFSLAALGYLLSVQYNGVATGFSLSQMNVVIATLGSIYLLKENKTQKEKRFIFMGLALVVCGGVLIGTIH